MSTSKHNECIYTSHNSGTPPLYRPHLKKKKEPAKLIETSLGHVAYFSLAASHLAHPTLSHFPSAPSLFCSHCVSSSICTSSPCSSDPPHHMYFCFPIGIVLFSVSSGQRAGSKHEHVCVALKKEDPGILLQFGEESNEGREWKLALQSALKMTLIRKFWIVSLWTLHKLKQMLHFTSLGLKNVKYSMYSTTMYLFSVIWPLKMQCWVFHKAQGKLQE